MSFEFQPANSGHLIVRLAGILGYDKNDSGNLLQILADSKLGYFVNLGVICSLICGLGDLWRSATMELGWNLWLPHAKIYGYNGRHTVRRSRNTVEKQRF
jgi:hypothetical protein